MRRTVATRAAVITGALMLSVGAATPAHAQFGKLKKMGADAIKEATKGKVGDKKETAKSSVPAGAKAENVPLLTEDKVALVVSTLLEYRARTGRVIDLPTLRKNADAVRPEWDQKRDAADKCLKPKLEAYEKSMQGLAPMAMAQRMNDLEEAAKPKQRVLKPQATALEARLKAARSAGDKRKAAFLNDSLNIVNARILMLGYGIDGCVTPYTPVAIIEYDLANTEYGETYASFDPRPAAAGVMTRREFGLARERIAIWAIMQEEPLTKNVGPYGVFTPEEEAALKANAADIKKLAPLFQSSTLAWATWDDLPSWDTKK